MRTKVQRWGNSLALRIPKAFAADSRLEHDSEVDISIKKGKIIISPLETTEYTLEALLSGINKKNLHNEIDTESPQGMEAW
ncbi:MAG: AbrB/MazE/SpoVT family DNA-binding domain-containing protein [Ignavibacteriaceae bacterium]|nr:AbrB/MazE/SpoVT family DNA-binding domain-containing protein [Ignavibacteriaceae bacterium]